MLLEVTRQALSPPPLPVALQTTCFLDSRAFPEAPYFLRAPWINSLCWSIRLRYWSEFILNVRPSMKVKKNISQFCLVRSLGFVTSSSDSSMYEHVLNIFMSQTGKRYLVGSELFWDGLLDGWLWPSSSTRWGATLKFVVLWFYTDVLLALTRVLYTLMCHSIYPASKQQYFWIQPHSQGLTPKLLLNA